MQKTAILPIVSVIFMAVSAVTGKSYDQSVIETIAEATAIIITGAIALWGIHKDHNKKEDGK